MEIRIPYNNDDAATKAAEARQIAAELKEDGAVAVLIDDEPIVINEGTPNAYKDGGAYIITYV